MMKINMIQNIESMDEFNQELNKKWNGSESESSKNVKSVSSESPTLRKTSEAQRRAVKRYYEKNKADIQNYYKSYYTDNREGITTNQLQYYNANKEAIIKN